MKRKYKNRLIIWAIKRAQMFRRKPHQLFFCVFVIAVILALVVVLIRDSPAALEDFVCSLLTGTVMAAVLSILICALLKMLTMHNEDPIKLTVDYDGLAAKYRKTCSACADARGSRFVLFRYDNVNSDLGSANLARCESCCSVDSTSCEMPIDVLAFRRDGLLLEVSDNPDSRYRLPGYVEANFETILACHGRSSIVNSMVFRVSDAVCMPGKVSLKTGRTTYFDSLVTNRAVDYRFCDGPTVREMFEYDGCLPNLSESELSNHLGFNVNVVTSDDVVVLALRRKDVSVAKRLYAPAVGSPVRVRYATGRSSCVLTAEGVTDAVCSSIRRELPLTEEEINAARTSGRLALVAFYRDLVEGGKPQLLYNLRIDIDFRTLSNRVASGCSSSDVGGVLRTGVSSLKGVRMDDLRHVHMASDGITVKVVRGNVEFLEMNPSYAFSTAALLLDDVEVSGW